MLLIVLLRILCITGAVISLLMLSPLAFIIKESWIGVVLKIFYWGVKPVTTVLSIIYWATLPEVPFGIKVVGCLISMIVFVIWLLGMIYVIHVKLGKREPIENETFIDMIVYFLYYGLHFVALL